MGQLKSGWLCLCLATGLVGSIVGCGGSDDEEVAGGPDTSSGSVQTGDVKPASTASRGGKKTPAGRPEIDGIPLDVFFPEPLLVVSQTDTIAKTDNGQETPTTGIPENVPDVEKPETPDPGTGVVAWNQVIPAERVKGEMKSIRLQLQQRLTTLASYNSSYLEIPIFGATLSLLAEVARRHPDDIAWKENSRYI
ncbi:MAG: hypothetical protein VB858_17930, partial [Planctomycetaceae bacterium]